MVSCSPTLIHLIWSMYKKLFLLWAFNDLDIFVCSVSKTFVLSWIWRNYVSVFTAFVIFKIRRLKIHILDKCILKTYFYSHFIILYFISISLAFSNSSFSKLSPNKFDSFKRICLLKYLTQLFQFSCLPGSYENK